MPGPLFNVYTLPLMVLNDNKCFYLLPPHREFPYDRTRRRVWAEGGETEARYIKKFYYGADNFKHGERIEKIPNGIIGLELSVSG
jgi:hypothetical protein